MLSLFSFISIPASPSPWAAHPPHRLTKGPIHQGPATGYNPFERQQAMPALPGLGLKCSSFLPYSSPGPPWLTPVHVEGFEGLRTSKSVRGWFHGVGKGLPGSASPVEVVTSCVGTQWLVSHELFGFMPTLLPRTSCCSTLLLWMGWTFFAFPASIYSWLVCSHLFPCQQWPLALKALPSAGFSHLSVCVGNEQLLVASIYRGWDWSCFSFPTAERKCPVLPIALLFSWAASWICLLSCPRPGQEGWWQPWCQKCGCKSKEWDDCGDAAKQGEEQSRWP